MGGHWGRHSRLLESFRCDRRSLASCPTSGTIPLVWDACRPFVRIYPGRAIRVALPDVQLPQFTGDFARTCSTSIAPDDAREYSADDTPPCQSAAIRRTCPSLIMPVTELMVSHSPLIHTQPRPEPTPSRKKSKIASCAVSRARVIASDRSEVTTETSR